MTNSTVTALTQAEAIYRSFCEDSGDDALDKVWDEYGEEVGPIQSGSLVERLILAAMQYALDHNEQ